MSIIDKVANPAALKATEAYKNTQELLGGNFKDVLNDAISTMKAGEVSSQKAAVNQTDILATLTAVNNAESTLNMIIAVRDRMVQSYQEVVRMPMG